MENLELEPTVEELKAMEHSSQELDPKAQAINLLIQAGIPRNVLDLLIADEKRQHEKKERRKLIASVPVPYYLTVNVHCQLCGTTHQKLFYMESKEDGLHSRELEFIPPEVVDFKVSAQKVRHCDCCKPVLSNMPAEWLAEMLIERSEVRF